jgi:hypothetical protein
MDKGLSNTKNAISLRNKIQCRINNKLCSYCGVTKVDAQVSKNCDKCKLKKRIYLQYIKDLAYKAYGGYKCHCCGETNKFFLTIDHINNNGAKHRKEIGKTRELYLWLKRNNYPSGFRILCFNCNAGRHINGGVCPHKMNELLPFVFVI